MGNLLKPGTMANTSLFSIIFIVLIIFTALALMDVVNHKKDLKEPVAPVLSDFSDHAVPGDAYDAAVKLYDEAFIDYTDKKAWSMKDYQPIFALVVEVTGLLFVVYGGFSE